MSDLVFTTRGQAEALAAQEKLARAAREAKREFEEGAKATQAWDSAQQSLKRSAESSLRSVTTEQERIVQQIDKIKAAYREGLILKPEAEQGVSRLRQRWIDLDTAVSSSKKNLGTVPAEIEKVEKPAGRLQGVFEKAFDPIRIAKFAAKFIGVGAAIGILRKELEDLQVQTDKIIARQQKGFDEASKGGDVKRAERLKGRVRQVQTIEEGAQAIAERQTGPFLSSDELSDIDEILASRGQGWFARTLQFKQWRHGFGGVRREDVASTLRTMAGTPGQTMPEIALKINPNDEFAKNQVEQLIILRKMADSLDKINNKDGGIPVDGN